MPNGVAVARSLAVESPITTKAAPRAPDARQTEIEQRIAEAAADAAQAVRFGIACYAADGQLPDAAKAAASAALAKVAMLTLTHFGNIDSNAVVCAAKRLLFSQLESDTATERTLGVALDAVFVITARVVRDERNFR